ncbi:FusB/FusC family EF-G-binding protein [Paenibacillus sepulcri]|uniref:FusB/FusC family EF-G-binding protein n=2 Tax=Paenibacillus sepulcri TaxID=359917 RepID=A0ABS7BX13_9BACL|nr:FusB/FusC family EF-G-binding protein [Paenibacillus sepulcri]
MRVPFIRNHQYNVIKKQAGLLKQALRTVSDLKVLESVRDSTEAKIFGLFPDLTDTQRQLLEKFPTLATAEDFQNFLGSLEPYIVEFPQITNKQIQKLFPKNKKLKLPDLSLIDFRYLTYLSWTDISTDKLFIVYHADGQFIGVEGRFTPTNKKSYCFLCNNYEELAFYSVKTRPAKSSPDYYKAFGNYLCLNNHHCNTSITDVAFLEKFIDSVKK